jgi:hypothetical protein
MALRFVSLNASIPTSGISFAHGIRSGGVAAAPTEWFWVGATAAGGTTGDAQVYRTTLPTTTQSQGMASSGASTVDFFCALPHSVIG